MNPHEPERVSPTCPRCDYDLSGLIKTWTDSCPLNGICSECGLEFECANVLSPRLLGPGWSYEHSLIPSADRLWRTTWVSLNPRRLCLQLKVDHRISVRRLIRFALLWLLAIHLGTFALTFGSVLISSSVVFRGDPLVIAFQFLICPYSQELHIRTGSGSFLQMPVLPIFVFLLGPLLLMPVWMLILGTSLQQAKVRKVHLLRGLCLALPGGVAWIALTIGATAAAAMTSGIFGMNPGLIVITLTLAWFAYHLLWWVIFIRNYLRLRHSIAIVLLNSLMSGLLLVTLAIVFSIR